VHILSLVFAHASQPLGLPALCWVLVSRIGGALPSSQGAIFESFATICNYFTDSIDDWNFCSHGQAA